MNLADFLPLEYYGISDAPVTGFNTDSRTIRPGEVFIAIKGEHFDGNDFIASAIAKGASAVISSKDFHSDIVIKVDDPLKFVQEMASCLRAKMTLPVVAITGSSGKTTTKNLLANILQKHKSTLATVGNFNSMLGMPLTMLNLRHHHHYGVFEIGMSSPGEIARLTKLLRPQIGIITNIGRAHLAGVGDDIANVAKEKSDLIANLEGEKVAILSCDDKYFNYMRDAHNGTTWYGFTLNEEVWLKHNKSVWYASDVKTTSTGYEFNAVIANSCLKIELDLLGKHNIANALAAIAAAKHLQVPDEFIIAGVAQTSAISGRLSVYENGAIRVIDDSYNANPESCKAAIATLQGLTGKKILVLGDMLALGNKAEEYHREIGRFAKESGIDYMFCYGKLSHFSADEFGAGASSYESQQELLKELKKVLGSCSVLVKGSAALKMSNVSKELIELVE